MTNQYLSSGLDKTCEDIKGIMMTTIRRKTMTRTRTTTMTTASELWDQIETWSFREGIHRPHNDDNDQEEDNKVADNDKDEDNNKVNNNDKGATPRRVVRF